MVCCGLAIPGGQSRSQIAIPVSTLLAIPNSESSQHNSVNVPVFYCWSWNLTSSFLSPRMISTS